MREKIYCQDLRPTNVRVLNNHEFKVNQQEINHRNEQFYTIEISRAIPEISY